MFSETRMGIDNTAPQENMPSGVQGDSFETQEGAMQDAAVEAELDVIKAGIAETMGGQDGLDKLLAQEGAEAKLREQARKRLREKEKKEAAEQAQKELDATLKEVKRDLLQARMGGETDPEKVAKIIGDTNVFFNEHFENFVTQARKRIEEKKRGGQPTVSKGIPPRESEVGLTSEQEKEFNDMLRELGELEEQKDKLLRELSGGGGSVRRPGGEVESAQVVEVSRRVGVGTFPRTRSGFDRLGDTLAGERVEVTKLENEIEDRKRNPDDRAAQYLRDLRRGR